MSHGHSVAMPDPVSAIRELATRAEVWVVDPRRTETARLAGHHLAPRPGTDYAVLAFLVREVLARRCRSCRARGAGERRRGAGRRSGALHARARGERRRRGHHRPAAAARRGPARRPRGHRHRDRRHHGRERKRHPVAGVGVDGADRLDEPPRWLLVPPGVRAPAGGVRAARVTARRFVRAGPEQPTGHARLPRRVALRGARRRDPRRQHPRRAQLRRTSAHRVSRRQHARAGAARARRVRHHRDHRQRHDGDLDPRAAHEGPARARRRDPLGLPEPASRGAAHRGHRRPGGRPSLDLVGARRARPPTRVRPGGRTRPAADRRRHAGEDLEAGSPTVRAARRRRLGRGRPRPARAMGRPARRAAGRLAARAPVARRPAGRARSPGRARARAAPADPPPEFSVRLPRRAGRGDGASA